MSLLFRLFLLARHTLLAALFCLAPQVSADDCERVAEVKAIAPGVYVRPGHYGLLFVQENLANIGFIVGQDCVAVIDSGGSPAEGRALQCAIQKITKTPVCYVIISHHHADHSLGSLGFKQSGAEIIGHAKLARTLSFNIEFYLQRLAQQTGQRLAEETIVLPDRAVAVGKPLELDLGERVLRLDAHPPAHTNNDLSVYDQQTGTLWLADLLFVEHVPAIEAGAKGWLEALAALRQQSAQQAVPGHGPTATPWPSAADDLMRYLTVLREEARALLDEGGDLEEAQKKVGYAERQRWQLFDEFHKRNVIRVYTELEWED